MQGVAQIRQCVMGNDATLCHNFLTSGSFAIFDKFSGYGLMPCLPTNFTYKSERTSGNKTTVTAEMPADDKTNYLFRMVFVNDGGRIKLNLPETLRTGLGEDWKDKLDFSEQLFLMMRQNMHDKLTCDVLRDLAVSPK